ncbi:MAG: hypothetical protein KY455_06435 [Euryarchaeota archaeon]|nr:hypothetical protein [Euryarchaeota archaeon]
MRHRRQGFALLILVLCGPLLAGCVTPLAPLPAQDAPFTAYRLACSFQLEENVWIVYGDGTLHHLVVQSYWPEGRPTTDRSDEPGVRRVLEDLVALGLVRHDVSVLHHHHLTVSDEGMFSLRQVVGPADFPRHDRTRFRSSYEDGCGHTSAAWTGDTYASFSGSDHHGDLPSGVWRYVSFWRPLHEDVWRR